VTLVLTKDLNRKNAKMVTKYQQQANEKRNLFRPCRKMAGRSSVWQQILVL